MAQAIVEICAQVGREQIGHRSGERHPPAGKGLGQIVQVPAGQIDPAARSFHQPGEQQCQFVPAAAAAADDRRMLFEIDRKGNAVDGFRLAVFGIGQAGGLKGPAHRLRAGLVGQLQGLVEQAGRIELLDHSFVLHLDVGLELVIVQQFLPRRTEVLVRRQHGGQRADSHVAGNHQVAADRIEEERRELRHEAVEELDGELAAENFIPDGVDAIEPAGDAGALEERGVVGMDFSNAGDRFADIVGKAADFPHPGLAERDDPLLQLWNDVDLQRIKRRRGEAEKDILRKDESQIDQQQATEIQGCRCCRTDVAADRLHLGGDHRNDLALGDFLEMGQRKAKDPRIEHIAQAAEHLLAQPPGVDVQHIFHAAAEDDKKQEAEAERHQEGDLLHFGAQNVARPAAPRADRLVDDRLRQFQREVDDRPGDHGQGKHNKLLPLAVFHDEAEDARLQRHVRLIAGGLAPRHPAGASAFGRRIRHQAGRTAAKAASGLAKMRMDTDIEPSVRF